MKDSLATTLRSAGILPLAATALLCLIPQGAQAQASKDRDVPAIYYFPESQSGNPRAPATSGPQAGTQPGYASPQQGGYAATPGTGGYGSGTADQQPAAEQPPIAFDTDAFCAAPDSNGKPRSEAWIKNCIAAANIGPNAPARKAREEVLQQQQNAAASQQ